jgi:hypothetical protein
MLRFYRSTIGKKVIMAVTGLVLVVFVIGTWRQPSGVHRSGEDERLCRLPAEPR